MSSTVGSGSGLRPPAAAASAPAVEDTSSHWAPHGPVLTACVVGINVLMILLIFLFFWRYFSGKRGPSASTGAGDDDDDASSSASLPVASPWAWAASRHRRSSKDHGLQPVDDVASALPVYVYSSSAGAGDESGKAPECAVCIVELRDGDSARLLPRCGHRFHADCVAAWLRLHATCPLCRASVVAPRASAADESSRDAKDDGGGGGGADCPV
ncbi:E3 ubiquitin-protein ligase Os03g0188200-like [Miscanthus floridulus]|uniref:E3 ubiquitin-protein ligase Os03g0188200-like n=1 Tax=Miscanthus floridulus TaxID=154761 RepID=UPI003457FEC5